MRLHVYAKTFKRDFKPNYTINKNIPNSKAGDQLAGKIHDLRELKYEHYMDHC